MEQSYVDNNYVIDLSYVKTPADIIYEFSSLLDNDTVKNKKIYLNIGDVELNQSQLLSIKALINSVNSQLNILEAKSTQTQQAASKLGIILANIATQKELEFYETPAENKEEPVESQNQYETIQTEEQTPEELDAQTSQEPALYTDTSNIDEYMKQINERLNETEQSTDETQVSDYVSDSAPDYAENTQIVTDENGPHYEEKQDLKNDAEDEEDFDYSVEEINYAIEQNQKLHDELDMIFDEERKLEELLDHQPGVEEIEQMLQSDNDYTEQDFEIDNLSTMYIKQTLRSGQVVNYDGNVVVIGDAHPGSEITAAGDITVWGILGGIAQAGSTGNEKARIRALKMNAIQLRIAGWFSRRPDSIKTIYTEKTSSFVPEEAKVVDGSIVLSKINER